MELRRSVHSLALQKLYTDLFMPLSLVKAMTNCFTICLNNNLLAKLLHPTDYFAFAKADLQYHPEPYIFSGK